MDTLGTSILSIGPLFRGRKIYRQGVKFVYCGEVVHSLECPLSEVPLVANVT